MRRVDVKTFEEMLNELIIREKESASVYDQPYLQIPIPVPDYPEQKRDVKEESSRVIIIDI
jgi:hypothetical protein